MYLCIAETLINAALYGDYEDWRTEELEILRSEDPAEIVTRLGEIAAHCERYGRKPRFSPLFEIASEREITEADYADTPAWKAWQAERAENARKAAEYAARQKAVNEEADRAEYERLRSKYES